MKKSKRAKTPKRENDVDMISELPDHILVSILSRLPTTEEVNRTSILSTRWRHLWTSIPSIDIDFSRGPKPPKKFKKNKFKNFVSSTLTNKSLDLDSFRLSCLNHYSMSIISQWINTAITRNVKLLQLMFCPKEYKDIELPNFLVTCASLEILRLFLFGRRLIFPTFTGFPALRVLELKNVGLFNEDLVKEFLKNCPLLEDLSLVDCLMDTLVVLSISCPNLKKLLIDNRNKRGCEEFFELEGLCGIVYINCPKLEFLEFAGHIAYHFLFHSFNSLKKAVIRPENTLLEEFDFDPEGNTIRELCAGIRRVEFLSISHHFVEALEFPVCFPNLKTLELTIDAFILDKIIEFLNYLPNLKSLHLVIQQQFIISAKYGDLDQEERRRILTRHLKRVEFLEFNGEQTKIEIAEFLLEYGDALEEMVFSWGNEAKYHEMSLKTMKKVSKFRKASSSVKLYTLLRNDVKSFSDDYISML